MSCVTDLHCNLSVVDQPSLLQGIDVFQDARLLTLAWPYYPKVISCVEAIAVKQ